MVLTDLGWTIRRVWSTEWWNDAPRALEKLHRQLVEDLEADRRRVAAAAAEGAATTADDGPRTAEADEEVALPPDDVDVEEDGGGPDVAGPFPPPVQERSPRPYADQAGGAADLGGGVWPVYVVADVEACGVASDPDRFHDPLYRPTLRTMVSHVIRTEGPIFDEVLVRRVARAHGFARAGGRIRETVLGSAEARFARTREEGRTIFWPEGLDPAGLPRSATPDRSSAGTATCRSWSWRASRGASSTRARTGKRRCGGWPAISRWDPCARLPGNVFSRQWNEHAPNDGRERSEGTRPSLDVPRPSVTVTPPA